MKKAYIIGICLSPCFAGNIVLDEIIVTNFDYNKNFSSSTFLDRKKISLIISKDGSITEILKTNPNITFGKNGKKSMAGGEISPKDISINGASHYQNNFMVDDTNFNNDINPAGYKDKFNNTWRGATLGTQAINLNADLLKSIEVFDSAVSAKYGDFQGGVVKAKTRDPKTNFSGIISSTYTNGKWHKTFLDEKIKKSQDRAKWMESSDFSKKKFRFEAEGYITENFGLLFDFSRLNSHINRETDKYTLDPKFASYPNEKRTNENYFIKGIAHIGDNTIIKPSFLHSKQKIITFIESNVNSLMENPFGGNSFNLNLESTLNNIFIEQSLGYSEFESSRYSYFKDGLYLYKRSNLKNWGVGGGISSYGGMGDIAEFQKTFNYKLDLSFDEKNIDKTSHKAIAGLEYINKSGSYETPNPHIEYDFGELPAGYKCKSGDLTCVNDDSFGGKGQFANKLWYYGDVDNKVKMDQISLYLEDEISFDKFKIRPGIRIQTDSLTKDFYKALRFATQYEFIDENFIGFGLNRYYGRNIFQQKIYSDTYRHQKNFIRNHPNDEWKYTDNDTNLYFSTRLKLPYDDEFSLFYNGKIDNFNLSLKYVKRESKNEIFAKRGKEVGMKTPGGFDDSFKIFVNNGKTSTDIYTITLKNKESIAILGLENNFEASFTHMKRKRNFKDYYDSDIKEYAIYNDKVIKASDLPAFDFYYPNSFKFSHNIKINNDLIISNFISYVSKIDDISQKGYKNKMSVYKSSKIPSHTTWDMRISYDKNLHNNIRFFANLDINNILNKKYIIAKGYYDTFGEGRNFWLEAGLKW